MQEKYKSMSNVPNLRFPEFDGEWEVKKLGEVASNKSGKYNPVNETDSIKCIEMEHLATETGQLLGYIDGSTSGSIKNVFNKGDVLFGKLRPYLKKYLQAPFDGVCSSEIWVLKGKNISNDFLYRIVQTNSFIDLANQSSGSKMPRADWNVVENGLFSIPSLPEQQKIATLLSLIDERIQTQSKIIGELKILKATLAQKIFSQELRFKDNKGNDFPDWKLKKLNEVCKIVMGQSPNSISYNTEEMGFPLIQGNADIFNRITSPRNWTTEITKECLIGDLILTVRAPVGAVAKSVHNACIGRGVCAIRGNSSNSNEFIYQFLLDYEDKWTKLEQGSTFTAVSGNEIKKVEIFIPCLEEQTKIANFLLGIDEKMVTENGVLEQYQQKKQYLLSNLFI